MRAVCTVSYGSTTSFSGINQTYAFSKKCNQRFCPGMVIAIVRRCVKMKCEFLFYKVCKHGLHSKFLNIEYWISNIKFSINPSVIRLMSDSFQQCVFSIVWLIEINMRLHKAILDEKRIFQWGLVLHYFSQLKLMRMCFPTYLMLRHIGRAGVDVN